MDRRLLHPQWLLAHAVVVAVTVVFVFLGLWQLSRYQERLEQNEVGERRIAAPPIELEEALAGSEELSSIEFRRVLAAGEYAPELEVLIRSQIHLGTAGFHVITPLILEDGRAVLVNRGWVPLGMDQPPVELAPPPSGMTTVEGWVELSRERPPLGPEDPATGRLDILNRVDVERIARQLPMQVAPVYLIAQGGQGSELPTPVRQPDFDDQGPHLAYAIQWFGFALVGLVGYSFLVRNRLGKKRSRGRI